MKKFDKAKAIDFIKRNKIPLIIFLVVIVALIIGLIVSFNIGGKSDNITKNEEEGMVANTNQGIISETTYEGLQFSNISLISENGYSTFSADVTNTTATNSTISDVNIILKDKNGSEIITLRGNIGEPLAPNETRTITAVTKGKFSNATTKEIAAYESVAR